jgi:hypothetical protein
MTTMDGSAAALAVGAILSVPVGLRSLADGGSPLAARLTGLARIGALPAGVLAAIALPLPMGPSR